MEEGDLFTPQTRVSQSFLHPRHRGGRAAELLTSHSRHVHCGLRKGQTLLSRAPGLALAACVIALPGLAQAAHTRGQTNFVLPHFCLSGSTCNTKFRLFPRTSEALYKLVFAHVSSPTSCQSPLPTPCSPASPCGSLFTPPPRRPPQELSWLSLHTSFGACVTWMMTPPAEESQLLEDNRLSSRPGSPYGVLRVPGRCRAQTIDGMNLL